MSDKQSKSHVPGAGGRSRGGSGAPAGVPGKRTRTQSLPPSATAVGPSTERLRATPAVRTFKLTEIGRESYDDITLTNNSDRVVDFFDFLQTILVAPDGVARPEGDFAIVGGTTSGEGLEPGAATTVTVAFHPQATHQANRKTRKKTSRKATIAVIDEEGAVAGTFGVQGTARPPSAETIDEIEIDELKSTARHSGRSLPAPKTYDDMRRHLNAASELIATAERADASELIDDVEARMAQAASYERVFQAARKHGLGTTTATQVVGRTRDEIVATARRLHGAQTVLPSHMDKLVTMFMAAEEPLKLTLGEIDHAPTLQAMHDATPAVLAGKGAVELGETAKQVVTDAAFAAGFGLGVLEGAGGALQDLVTGVGDALALAFDLAKAWVTGGMIGVSLTLADKISGFFGAMPDAIAAMGEAFERGWNAPGSFERGNFRGEVIGYVAAQIAIIVISGGTAAEGVSFASLSRWGKVARLIQTLDAAGDIVSWAHHATKAIDVADEILNGARKARRTVKIEAPHGRRGADGGDGPNGDGHNPSTVDAGEAAGTTVPDRGRPPYEDPRIDPDGPRRPLDRRELEPHRRLDTKKSWREIEKAQKAGDQSFAVGRKLKKAEDGHSILDRLSSGDASALEDVGITDYPKDLDPTGREWALIETRDGFAIYAGGYNKVEFPVNVRVLGHTHPGPNPALPHDGPDVDRSLRVAADGEGLSYGEVLQDIEMARHSGIIPSASDINAISDGTAHVLYTRYVHAGDGKVTNPVPGDRRPRVRVHLSDAKVLTWNPRTRTYWYEVTAVAKDAAGKPLWSGRLYAQWSAPARVGDTFPTKPAFFPAPSNPAWRTP